MADAGAAEAFYTGPWLVGIRERYGMDPQIKDCPAVYRTDRGTIVVQRYLLDRSSATREADVTKILEISAYEEHLVAHSCPEFP